MPSNSFRRRLLGATSGFVSGAVAALILPAACLAQAATQLPPVAVDTDKSGTYCPLDSTSIQGAPLTAKRFSTNDTTSLLDGVPGVATTTGGGVSGLPVIHGMADDRNKVTVDGMPITSACPNHMNPATSYIDPSRVNKMDVVAGITPVSMGGDSIGGSVAIQSAPPVFAAPGEGLHTGGSASTFYRSNNRAIGGSLSGDMATENYSLGYSGSAVRARDYHDGDGNRIATSQYAAGNHAATLAARNGDNMVTVQGGQQFIPYEGFPNQRMDLLGNRGRFLNSSYQGDFDWGKVESRVYWQDVNHFMDFLSEKFSGIHMPMYTEGKDRGYALKGEIPLTKQDTLRLGNELHAFTLQDWWPGVPGMAPSMGPGTFQNINNGSRDVLGTYAEWEKTWTPAWTSLLGARNDTVWMNTGNVAGYSPNDTGMGGSVLNYGRDSAAFNAQDHHKTDVNLDITALARYEAERTSTYEAGASQKMRSPNLYERYAWSTGDMASSMVTWFGDGNGYVGNINLKPETAYTASVSGDWHDAARDDWSIKLTPYATYVKDYIDVDKVKDFTGIRAGFSLYQFANHDAILYGSDLSGRKLLVNSTNYGRFDFTGSLGWVHGERVNTGDGLYHLMPLNAKFGIEQKWGRWANGIDTQMVNHDTNVETLRHEPMTPGYAVVNLRSAYALEAIRFDLGIENLFNKQYYSPLGGIDYGDFKQSGSHLPYRPLAAQGRSFNAGMTVTF